MKHTSIGIIAAVLILLFAGSASAWYGDYGYRIPLNIDNTAGSALTNYQLNVSLSGIDADSIRVVNETAGTTIPHWCETVTDGDCYEVWFNVTNLPAGVWTNTTYYIYYHYYSAACESGFDTTFTKKYNDTGLVLELHVDDGTGTQVTDTSGSGNHGTMVNMVSPYGWQGVDGGQWNGRSDTAFADGDHLRFDGSNDQVNCGNDVSLNVTDAITISTWMNTSSTATQFIISKFDITDASYELYCSAVGVGGARFRLYDSVGGVTINSNTEVQDGNWHHVVGRLSGTTMSIYVDGVLKNTGTLNNPITPSGAVLNIATRNNGLFFAGGLDEVRIYDRALSEEEIYRQYIRCKYTPDPPSTSLGVVERAVHPVIELLSQTPSDLFQNSTGYFNQTWEIIHTNPLNESAITMIYRNIYDGEANHSLRMPGNDRATDGWRGANRNETGANRLIMEDVSAIFGGNYYNWSAGDIEHNVRMHIENVDSTHTLIHFNDSVQMTTFPASWYLDRSEMIDATKTEIAIYKHYSRLVKIYDSEMLLMNDRNYTISIWIDTIDNGLNLVYPLSVWWANESFDPNGGVAIVDSPYATQMGVITDTEWETRESFPHSNDYMRFNVYAGQNPEIQSTGVGYLYFDYDYPQSFIMNCTDVATSTDVSFADTNVMWTSDTGSSVYTPLAYTPNIFLTFHRTNQAFQSQLWAMESDNTNLTASYIEETIVQQSNFAPGSAVFSHFGFMGFNDTTMDCVYRGTLSPTLSTCGDPDGGTVSGNLTLCYGDGTHVAIINNTFSSDVSEEFVFDFNVAPYYSTTDIYTLKLVCTDDETDTSVSWLPVNFALSPTGTTGALYNGKSTSPRILFWGMTDIPTLYTTLSNVSALSYSGGIYTMHQAFHHGQYGDAFDFGESVRIESRDDVTTPFYRFTGDDTFDDATITSWNISLGAPAPTTDTYRAHIYSDEYYSSVDITNSGISNLGSGEEPYAGIYLQNAEGSLIDNNVFTYNGQGIALWNGGNLTISNNVVTYPQTHTISLHDIWGNATVVDNMITSDVETSGIVMENGGANNLFDNNTISDVVESAFRFVDTSDTVVSDNVVTGAQRGIVLSRDCQNFTISGNDITVNEDVFGHPAWGVDVLAGTHNMTGNTLDVNGGYGFAIKNWFTATPCVNTIMTNNRVSITSGTHPDAGTFADYVFYLNTTGNVIRDPVGTSDIVSILGADSVTIENTDNVVFTHAGNNHAVISNPGITQFVDDVGVYMVTQTGMTITPSTGTLDFYGFTWAEEVAFTLDASDPAAHVEIDAIRNDWVHNNMWLDVGGTFYGADDAGPTGHVAYNYTGGFVISPLAFSIHDAILEGWQALGQDTTESYSDLVMIIGVCVLILVVGGIIIGLRSFAGEISPEVVIVVAIAIGFGLLVLITVVEVVPSVMAPMENITMEGL